ncbi:putative membrane protein [Sinorhizobium sp. RAC02]|nr:putative membrane protein [Sinorhizobium sp. RAC02]
MIVLALGATVIASATLAAIYLLLDIDAARAPAKARVF